MQEGAYKEEGCCWLAAVKYRSETYCWTQKLAGKITDTSTQWVFIFFGRLRFEQREREVERRQRFMSLSEFQNEITDFSGRSGKNKAKACDAASRECRGSHSFKHSRAETGAKRGSEKRTADHHS